MKAIIMLAILSVSLTSYAKGVVFNPDNKDEVKFMNLVIADLVRKHDKSSSNSEGCLFLRAKGVFSTERWQELGPEYKRELGLCLYIEVALDTNKKLDLASADKWIDENPDEIRHNYSEADYINLMAKIVREKTSDETTIAWRHRTLCSFIKRETVINDEYNYDAIEAATPLCSNS